MILFVHIPTFGGVALFYFSRSESYAVMPLWFSSAVPLVDSDVEDLFACLFCCLYILFGKMSLSCLCPFSNWILGVLLFSFEIYIFKMLVLCQTCDLQMFSPKVYLSFQPLRKVLYRPNIFYFDDVQFFSFSFKRSCFRSQA